MNSRDTSIALALAVGLMALLTPFASLGVDWHHDGLMLKPALDVLSGQVLFRDTFTAYGALTTYLQVIALLVYPSLLSIKLLTACAYSITIFFLYAAWRMFLARSLALLACAMFVLSIPSSDGETFLPWSSVYAMMFQSIALYSLFQIIRSASVWRWAFVLGIACASAFWCRQPVGLIMSGCVVVIGFALSANGWAPVDTTKARMTAWFAAGGLIISLPLLFGIVISGALPAWWYQNFLWPKKWATTGFGASYWHHDLASFVAPGKGMLLIILILAGSLPIMARRYWSSITSREIIIWYAVMGALIFFQRQNISEVFALQGGGWSFLIPVAIIAQAALSLFLTFWAVKKTKTTECLIVAALAGISLGSLMQYYPVPDPWHIVWALAPAYGLVVFMIWRCTGWNARILSLMMTAGFLPEICTYADSVKRTLTSPTVTLDRPRALRGMRVTPLQAHRFEVISSAVERVLLNNRDIASALIGTEAIFLCFTPNLENPTPYVITWDGLASVEEDRKRSRFIHNMRPLLFIQRPTGYNVDDFLAREEYVSLVTIPELKLEITAPRESLEAREKTH